MRGFIDLHCHYLPAIDDGVRTLEEGVQLCTGLASIGYDVVVATPHIRSAMFDNRRTNLEQVYAGFSELTREVPGMPATGLSAEHFFDDVFWTLLAENECAPYPGGAAMLVEFPPDSIPIRVEDRFFEMNVRGLRPVLAHPERYSALFKRSDALDPLLEVGALPLLDLMSLVGKYGDKPRRAAERMLDEDMYFAACTDSHKPSDTEYVREAILKLEALIGEDDAFELLAVRPRHILEGTIDEA